MERGSRVTGMHGNAQRSFLSGDPYGTHNLCIPERPTCGNKCRISWPPLVIGFSRIVHEPTALKPRLLDSHSAFCLMGL